MSWAQFLEWTQGAATWINIYINPIGLAATFGGFYYTIKQINSIESNQKKITAAVHKFQIKECLYYINEAQQHLQLSKINYQLLKKEESLNYLDISRNKLLSSKHRLSSIVNMDLTCVQRILTDITLLHANILKIKSSTSEKTIEGKIADFFELEGLIQQWYELISEQFLGEDN